MWWLGEWAAELTGRVPLSATAAAPSLALTPSLWLEEAVAIFGLGPDGHPMQGSAARDGPVGSNTASGGQASDEACPAPLYRAGCVAWFQAHERAVVSPLSNDLCPLFH